MLRTLALLCALSLAPTAAAQVFITSVQVESLPFSTPNGSGWDLASGPELVWTLFDANGDRLTQGNQSTDVSPRQLPLRWETSYQLLDADRVLRIGLYDYDDMSDADWIGSTIPFTLRQLSDMGEPPAVRLTDESGQISVMLELAWQQAAAPATGLTAVQPRRGAAYQPVVMQGWGEGYGETITLTRSLRAQTYAQPGERPMGDVVYPSGHVFKTWERATRVAQPGIVRFRRAVTLTGHADEGMTSTFRFQPGDEVHWVGSGEGSSVLLVDGYTYWFDLNEWSDTDTAEFAQPYVSEFWLQADEGRWVKLEGDDFEASGGW